MIEESYNLEWMD